MVHEDLNFIRRLLANGELTGPVLELGGGYGGDTCCEVVRSAGLTYTASDIHPAPGVEVVLNFEDSAAVEALAAKQRFGTILVLNVLEHTFEPTKILDNAVKLLAERGCVVVIAPAAWPLHDFPKDYVRLLPHWYERYAETRGLSLSPDSFEYIGCGPVRTFCDARGQLHLPPPHGGKGRRIYSRMVHKLFNTTGRSHAVSTHSAIGAVLRKR